MCFLPANTTNPSVHNSPMHMLLMVAYIDISIAAAAAAAAASGESCEAIFIFNLTLMLACCKQTSRG